jgi:proline iminopeptidase
MPEKRYWDAHEPDATVAVDVRGHRVFAYSFGAGDEVVLCLNGGPGLACDYIRDSHSFLVEHGYRVVAYDQLGAGRSDRPDDPALWAIGRYAEEVEAVRARLGLGRVHLLGQSWGGWLAIEYCCKYLKNVKTLILEDTSADIPHLVTELDRLRSALGPESVSMMLAHEALGTYDHPEYQAAVTVLSYRHVCRLKEWPDPVRRSLATQNMAPYRAIQGANEFVFTGNLKGWSRLEAMRSFHVPALIVVGRHDEMTPACALKMKAALPNPELVLFENSSHQPFFEEPERFQRELVSFLAKHPAP